MGKKYTPSATDSVRTPDIILKFLKRKYECDTMFDPCPYNPNYTVDGLMLDWRLEARKLGTNTVFVNPPYSTARKWIQKSTKYEDLTIILLIKNEALGSKYFSKINTKSDIIFVTPHVTFKNYDKKARFSSLIMVFHPLATNSFEFWNYED